MGLPLAAGERVDLWGSISSRTGCVLVTTVVERVECDETEQHSTIEGLLDRVIVVLSPTSNTNARGGRREHENATRPSNINAYMPTSRSGKRKVMETH